MLPRHDGNLLKYWLKAEILMEMHSTRGKISKLNKTVYSRNTHQFRLSKKTLTSL